MPLSACLPVYTNPSVISAKDVTVQPHLLTQTAWGEQWVKCKPLRFPPASYHSHASTVHVFHRCKNSLHRMQLLSTSTCLTVMLSHIAPCCPWCFWCSRLHYDAVLNRMVNVDDNNWHGIMRIAHTRGLLYRCYLIDN